MSEPFLAELRLMSFAFAPKGWAMCNGQLMPINQNQALFSLLGTTYGGDGRVNFGLPDLRGRVPIHFRGSHTLGEKAGTETVTVTQAQMPQHIHFFQANSTPGNTPNPTNNVLASNNNLYTAPANLTNLNPATISSTGGSQPHENRQPYLVLNYCIALQGIFPSQN
ncbi:MAG TPA: tail fiber protein [Allosphingosinicella sp.]|jgi:microcystin-dependent protein